MKQEQRTPDLPLGLGMALALDTEALSYFGTLDAERQNRLVNYIQTAKNGSEAKARIAETMRGLQGKDISGMIG